MSNRPNSSPFPKGPIRQAGVTLVELLVALVIGIFLVGAVGVLYVSTATGSRASVLESQMNEDATLALELLQQQLRLAGFSTLDEEGKRRFHGQPVRGCDGGFNPDADGGVAEFGELTCHDNDATPDSIAIRYEATLLNSQEVEDSGVKYPDNCTHNALRPWTPGASEGSAETIALADNRFFIANDDDNDNVPTLYCRGRNGDPASNLFSAAAALVPNIEDMQLLYAVTAKPENDKPLPHQVTSYKSAREVAALDGQWSRVAAVRICLIARSAQRVPGAASAEEFGTYRDCNGDEQSASDGYVRRAYVTTVQLRNARPAVPATYDMDGGQIRNPWAFLDESSE